MALSLDSIHQPLNDFFLNHFQTAAGSRVLFRFDALGSVISEQDFIDPNHPDAGYSANLAAERFSDLVNRVPIEDSDGLSIDISQAEIDQTYFFELLNPSLPFVPDGADDQTRNSIVASFSQISADAKKLWDTIKQESSTGLMLEFRPSLASPKDWYDKTNKGNWTTESFKVTEPATPTPVDNTPRFQLWRMKIDDATMAQIVPLTVDARPVEPAHLATTLLMAHPVRPAMTTPSMVKESFAPASPMMTASVKPMMKGQAAPMNMNVEGNAPATAGVSFDLQNTYLRQASQMPLNQRLALLQYINNNAPTQPATTNSISISFDYCVVTISRPWYREGFIDDTSWYIPSKTKGQLTAHDSGANLILLPVGFVAIRRLNIQAQWPAEDKACSQHATDFGPFKVDSGMVNDTVSHEGIQIIGWLLERMPDLPPNDPPAPP
jgi:hypothetical protein